MKVQFQALQGYGYGAVQPSVLLRFPNGMEDQSGDTRVLSAFLDSLGGEVGKIELDVSDRADDPASTVSVFVHLIAALNSACGDKRFTAIKVFQDGDAVVYAIPTLSTDLVWNNLAVVSKLLKEKRDTISQQHADSLIEHLKTSHRKFLPGGTNAIPFLSAAAERRIPFKVFMRDYLIFGYGAGSRIFRSTITERETSIGVGLAGNKVDTNRLLKLSGLPVAEQARVQSLNHAKHFAQKFGYPVVLKPDNESRGRGVYTNITDDTELEAVFTKLKKDYPSILLEKHIEGDYHRINVMGGELLLAVRRQPPQVTGDGASTVLSLIEDMNASPERNGPNPVKNKVLIDDDLHRCLIKQKLELNDVLESGRTVYLKSISTMGRGGSQEHIEARMHPENIELCRKIARIMRLELFGIDFLSPDMSQPWYSNGTTICEVNAQPQLHISSLHAYPMLLKNYVPSQPRVELSVSNEHAPNQEDIFDTAAETVRINLSVNDALGHGSPVQYFDTLTIADDVSDTDRKMLNQMLVSVWPDVAA